MRVLMLTTSFPTPLDAGWGPFIALAARSVCDRGNDVRVLSMSDESRSREFTYGGVSVKTVSYARRPLLHREPGLLPSLKKHPFALAQLPGLIERMRHECLREIDEFRPDIIHAHWMMPAGFIANLTPKKKVPFVVTAWGADAYLPNVPPIRSAYRSIARNCCGMSAVSSALADRLRVYGIDREIRVIPNATDTERFRPKTEKPSSDGSALTIGIVGRLIERKHTAEALEGIRLAAERSGARIGVHIAGDGPERDNVDEIMMRMPPSVDVRRSTSIPHSAMPDFYRTIDILVHCGEGEGLPTAAIEAMASGVPVVTPAHDYWKDVIDDASGYLFHESAIASGVSTSLLAILSDEARYTRTSLRCREVIESRHSLAASGESYESFYAEAMETFRTEFSSL